MRPALVLMLLAGAAQEKDEPVPGLVGEYFDVGEEIDDFPSLKDMKPAARKIDRQINFAETKGRFNGTGLIDQFYVRWTGSIRIPKDGKYTFSLESDDGSRLLLDGRLIVDNNGLHGMEERTGEVELKAGDHELRVEFFDNTAGAGCKLRWECDDLAKEIVPATALFHKRDKVLDR